ncbi:MAG: DsrE family protein [Actinobacteria bacterium]|nr:DsrE family protein [Actinomycetota bacterium]
MGSLLVHITHGPEAPTRAALGTLVAKAALDQGHTVRLFLAGDGAQLIRDASLDAVQGVGTGAMGDNLRALVDAGVEILVSGASSKARGVTDADLEGKNARFATPGELVEVTFASDRVLTY